MKNRRLIIIILILCIAVQWNNIVEASTLTPSGVEYGEIENIVDEIMNKEIGATVPGSAVSIVKDGEIIFSKAYGMADLEKGVEVSPEKTVFEIGSISKTFTWTAIMQLVDKDKINLSDDIREYIGYDRLDLKYSKPIRILDLMNHTAGFEENASEMMTFDKDKLIPLDEWVSSSHQPKQVYEPGTVIAYSNFSTDIAGLIIERISGMKFEEYIKENIFIPLDMNSSTAYANYDGITNIEDNKANGYGYKNGEFLLMPENYLNEAPAGAISSTAKDMAKYMIGLLDYDNKNGKSLFKNPSIADEVHSDTLRVYEGMPSIAHGFWARVENEIKILEHGGNTTNFSAFISLVPSESFGICVLTNLANESSGVRTEVVDRLITEFNHSAVPSKTITNEFDLSGNYTSSRMIHSNFLSSIYLISGDSIVVEDNEDGYIDVSFSVEQWKEKYRYAEIAPQVYERSDSIKTYFDTNGGAISHLKFNLDSKGNVVSISSGNIRDYIKLPTHKSINLNRTVFLVASILYLIGFIYIVISFIRRKKKKTSNEIVNSKRLSKRIKVLNILGLINIINIVFSVTRFMLEMTSPIGNFKVYLILNCILLVLMTINSIKIFIGIGIKKIKSKDRYYGIAMLVASTLLVLWEMNYHYLSFWNL